jgi:hypothetical protein
MTVIGHLNVRIAGGAVSGIGSGSGCACALLEKCNGLATERRESHCCQYCQQTGTNEQTSGISSTK